MNEKLVAFANTHLTREISQGSTVLYQGEVPRFANILVDGIVRVYSISKLGEEQIVTFHMRGDPFPASWIFNKSASSLFFYEAMTPCKIAYISKSELIDFIHSHKAVLSEVLHYFSSSYAASLIRINAMQQPRARDKLLHTLYYLAVRHGQGQNGNLRVPITLTHQTLASLVGLTRETTAIEMSKLKKQGIISYKKQQYDIQTNKLLELLGEESFHDIHLTG